MDEALEKNLYKALKTKDSRYDGRIYYGVKTTGIYCRPICPALPFEKNILFFKSKTEAEVNGFRPCLRCRPDLSPLSPQWNGSAAIVRRALALLERNLDKHSTLESVAGHLGMTERHLRRIFEEFVGASPQQIINSERLHLARQLLSQTGLPVTEIALTSGFNSVRRFNDAFLKTYKKSPTDFKREFEKLRNDRKTLKLSIPVAGPFDWDHLLDFFRSHEVYSVDQVQGNTYIRHFKSQSELNSIQISYDSQKNSLQVDTAINHSSLIQGLINSIKNMLDLKFNVSSIDWPVNLKKIKGITNFNLRIPGAFDEFETAVNIILGQLVSTKQARQNIQKLIEYFGEKVENRVYPDLKYLFPTPEILASADLSPLGITRTRALAVQELAKQVSEGKINLSQCFDIQKTKEQLLQIKGIGPWTTEMIALRCLGDTDAFPETDLIIRRACKKFGINPVEVSPWRGYLAILLLKNYAKVLTNKGKK